MRSHYWLEVYLHFLIILVSTTTPPKLPSYSPSLRSGTDNQGLVHMGKGTIGLNPFYHDGTVMSHGAMAGLLSVIISFTDAKSCEYFLVSSFIFLSWFYPITCSMVFLVYHRFDVWLPFTWSGLELGRWISGDGWILVVPSRTAAIGPPCVSITLPESWSLAFLHPSPPLSQSQMPSAFIATSRAWPFLHRTLNSSLYEPQLLSLRPCKC